MAVGLASGAQIDGFRIDAPLHSGGNGFVYRVSAAARDPGFALVMKVPGIGAGQPPLALVAFETEAAILRLLTGPYVPRFVAAGDLAHTPYLVMEHIEGTSLADIVARAASR